MKCKGKNQKHGIYMADSDIGMILDFQMPIQLVDDVPMTEAYR